MRSAGAIAYQGFDYQIEASIWVTLELLLQSARATGVTIEPVETDEDLQTELRPEDAPADKLQAAVHISGEGGYRALYQMKTRSTGPWTVPALRQVTGNGLRRAPGTRGPAPRKRAVERLLEDDSCMYFLITDAGVDRSLFEVSAPHLRFQPGDTEVPPDIIAEELERQAGGMPGTGIVARSKHFVLPRFVRAGGGCALPCALNGLLECGAGHGRRRWCCYDLTWEDKGGTDKVKGQAAGAHVSSIG